MVGGWQQFVHIMSDGAAQKAALACAIRSACAGTPLQLKSWDFWSWDFCCNKSHGTPDMLFHAEQFSSRWGLPVQGACCCQALLAVVRLV